MKNDNDLKCLECKFVVCEKCKMKDNKLQNKYRKLQNYVYFNLEKYGNTVLSKKVYEELGQATIIKDLKENGFKNISFIIGAESGAIIVKAAWWAKKETV